MPLLTKINTNVIADNAVTAAKTSGTAEQELTTSANIDLSGTTTGQKLQLGDAFTLTGDLTVNHDLVLGKVRDDGTGQSLTGDGKTLTGTGTLTMGSSFEGEPKAGRVNFETLTGGSIGSAVTGGTGLAPQIPISFTVGHTTFTGGTAWFDTAGNYLGVDTDAPFSAGQVITRWKVRESNNVVNCDIWFLVMEQSTTATNKYYVVAGWKFHQAAARGGIIQEFHVANAIMTVGNVLSDNGFQIPSTSFGTNGNGAYYLGVLGADDRQGGDKNGAIFADSGSGGQIDYVVSSNAGFPGYPDAITLSTAEFTMQATNEGLNFHIQASGYR